MPHHVDRIVVGFDDSGGGRAALRFALDEAVRRGAHVDVVAAFPVRGRQRRSIAEVADAARGPATATVNGALARLDGSPPAVTVLAVGGDAGEVLVHAARTADLLVVGHHDRGRVAGAVRGSVGLHCVRHASCPVTVVHASPDGAGAG